jgi:bifunctional non-homologous end joining protein LigD
MLASVGHELPSGREWVFEPKYDGIRILAAVGAGGATLVSRNGLDKTAQFPEVVEALDRAYEHAREPLLLDGEIVALASARSSRKGAEGAAAEPARFQELQSRMHVTDSGAIQRLRKETPAAYMVFDLLLEGSESLIDEPWRERREALVHALDAVDHSGALRISDVSENGREMLGDARRRGWEGVIAKRADATYRPGERSQSWRKLKIEHRQEFVIGGWTEPRRSREYLGAILLGYYTPDGRLTYAGHTGTGFTRASLASMHKKLARLERQSSPFSPAPRTNERAHWVRPCLVAEIKFNEWTTEGKLRQPVFMGLRDDKDARSVVHEPESLQGAAVTEHAKAPAKRKRANTTRIAVNRTSSARSAGKQGTRKAPAGVPHAIIEHLRELEQAGEDGTIELPTGALDVSNLGKVFFPKTKTTKGDVMRFYAQIAPMLLPAIEDRPLVMKRFPNGVGGKAFYQQKAPTDPPPAVRVEVVSDEGLTPQPRLIGGDLATLLYLVQLGAISVDPWHSRVQSVQMADYSIIDLDPGPRAQFKRVIDVAHAVKDVLDQLGLHAIPKTSGATGLHIVLPLPAGVPNEGARTVAELVATVVAERYPKLATVERWVKSRPASAIYVDYLQNIRGKTVAGVYSVRAQPIPSVSTPLHWDEVTSGLDPRDFTIDTLPERLRRVGDLWAAGMKKPNSLDRVLPRKAK